VSCKKNNSISAARVLFAVALLAASAWGQMNNGVMSPPANTRPPRLENVGIEQHLDAQVPPDLTFRDDSGKTVKLGDYFGRKPLILNLVYYNCTMLCGEALAGLASAMRLVKFDVGNEFDVVTVSFDPRETPEMAAAKKKDYVARYGRSNAASGWHFLTGQPDSINALTKIV
jgi:protein SCO1/2